MSASPVVCVCKRGHGADLNYGGKSSKGMRCLQAPGHVRFNKLPYIMKSPEHEKSTTLPWDESPDEARAESNAAQPGCGCDFYLSMGTYSNVVMLRIRIQ